MTYRNMKRGMNSRLTGVKLLHNGEWEPFKGLEAWSKGFEEEHEFFDLNDGSFKKFSRQSRGVATRNIAGI
ncbi:unnamed protein product [Cochlearia groenlandica]